MGVRCDGMEGVEQSSGTVWQRGGGVGGGGGGVICLVGVVGLRGDGGGVGVLG